MRVLDVDLQTTTFVVAAVVVAIVVALVAFLIRLGRRSPKAAKVAMYVEVTFMILALLLGLWALAELTVL